MIEQFAFDNLSALLRRLYANIQTPPVLDMAEYFPARDQLQRDFKPIQAEAMAVFESNPDVPRFHDIASSQHRISDNDGKNWRMFLVKSYGRMIAANAAKTAKLAEFLLAHPEVATAGISYLDPGKHIPPHKGPFRGILRYHLCLYAPDAKTDTPPWLRVEQETVSYTEGGDLLWDDTFVHEVLNPGPNPRIALLLDVKRPVKSLFHRGLYRIVLGGGWIYTYFNEKKMRAAKP